MLMTRTCKIKLIHALKIVSAEIHQQNSPRGSMSDQLDNCGVWNYVEKKNIWRNLTIIDVNCKKIRASNYKKKQTHEEGGDYRKKITRQNLCRHINVMKLLRVMNDIKTGEHYIWCGMGSTYDWILWRMTKESHYRRVWIM